MDKEVSASCARSFSDPPPPVRRGQTLTFQSFSPSSSQTVGEWVKSTPPIGRIGQPAELGGAFVFLAGPDASFVSGQVIHVNGGSVLNT